MHKRVFTTERAILEFTIARTFRSLIQYIHTLTSQHNNKSSSPNTASKEPAIHGT
jgi:hypothetical protein